MWDYYCYALFDDGGYFYETDIILLLHVIPGLFSQAPFVMVIIRVPLSYYFIIPF